MRPSEFLGTATGALLARCVGVSAAFDLLVDFEAGCALLFAEAGAATATPRRPTSAMVIDLRIIESLCRVETVPTRGERSSVGYVRIFIGLRAPPSGRRPVSHWSARAPPQGSAELRAFSVRPSRKFAPAAFFVSALTLLR